MAEGPVEPAPAIFGYTSRFSFAPGERVPIHVSCEQVPTYAAQLVRLRHGYEGPESPGFLETELASAANGEYPGAFHEPNTGSYVTVPGDDGVLSALIAWTIDFTFQSTTPDKPLQYLLGAWDASCDAGYAVVLEDGRASLVFGDGEGGHVSFACEPQIEARAWYRVVATFDAATGDATLRLEPTTESVSAHRLPGASLARGDAKRFRVPFPPAVAAVPFRIGAGSTGDAGFPEATGHFNGKIGNPLVYPTANPAVDAAPLAEWDFARSDRSDRALLDDVVDVSGGGFHAVCTNSPTRAVTGSNWTGREPNFRHAPGEYGAIHFHDDDLDDAQWPEAFAVDLPRDLESGVYAVRLRGGDTECHVPFVVRPGPDSKRNAVALLLPTGSYLAYANDRLQFDTAGTELLIGHTPVVSRHDLELQRHYDFGGSNYEVHADGSGVLYSSRRRPIITLDPALPRLDGRQLVLAVPGRPLHRRLALRPGDRVRRDHRRGPRPRGRRPARAVPRRAHRQPSGVRVAARARRDGGLRGPRRPRHVPGRQRLLLDRLVPSGEAARDGGPALRGRDAAAPGAGRRVLPGDDRRARRAVAQQGPAAAAAVRRRVHRAGLRPLVATTCACPTASTSGPPSSSTASARTR